MTRCLAGSAPSPWSSASANLTYQRDNNQNTRNPCKHWFAGVSFYQISSIWCLL